MSEPTRISKPFASPSPKDAIKMALTQAGMMRGAKLDKETLSLYSARLLREPIDDVIDALERLAEMPREEYESALPDMGTLLQMVSGAGVARHNRDLAALDQEYVRWRCQACKGETGGFYPRARNAAAEIRYCQRPARQVRENAASHEICGGNLDPIFAGGVAERESVA